MFKNRYRIVRDGYSGYEVQVRYWFSPLYFQCHGKHGPANTHKTIELAESFAELHASKIVKYLTP